MKHRLLFIAILIGVLGATFVGGYFLGGRSQDSESLSTVASGTADYDHTHEETSESAEKTIWTCSMHPQIQLPEPGKCPICFMDLIPLKKDSSRASGVVNPRRLTLSPEARKLARVEVAPVERRAVETTLRLFGKVEYDERRLSSVTSWIAGRIDALYVDYLGADIKKGQAMAKLYSPELYAAQAELVYAISASKDLAGSGSRLVRETASATINAAREKLRLLGMTAGQIRHVERAGKPNEHVTIVARDTGVVIKKDVLEGAYVKAGSPIYTLADLSRVWVVLEAYESDLPNIQLGQTVRFTTRALPGEEFTGTVSYIDTAVNEKTRTVRVRLEVKNPGRHLKPGMLVTAQKRKSQENEKDVLVIPATAPLLTGKRAIVYVADPEAEGAYVGREVVLGPRAGDVYVVKNGVSEGEQIVVNGAFKIDSALQIQAKPSMMSPASDAPNVMMSVYEPSPAMTESLRALESSFDTLGKTVVGDDLEEQQQAFQEFYNALCAVDPTNLQDQAAVDWKELSVTLGNDAVLGGEAEARDEVNQLFADLKIHYTRLTNQFPLPPDTASTSGRAPQNFKQALGNVYLDYLGIPKALSHDQLEPAKQAASKTLAALGNVDGTPLSGMDAQHWAVWQADLEEALQGIASAPDLAAARTALEPASEALVRAIGELGALSPQPVFKLFCPMAFDNKGAIWLWSEADVLNPYFGEAMLKCGEVKGKVRDAVGRTLGNVPEVFKRQVGQLYNASLGLPAAMAAGSLDGVHQAGNATLKALHGVDMELVPRAGHADWMTAMGEMRSTLNTMVNANDIETARTALKPFTQALTSALDEFGVITDKPVFELFCPMAFDNAGATWLWNEENVLNPYFGEAMLKCGEVKRAIASGVTQ
ncbi:efflux RND transporter periplasmic adaptor subunit [Desulfovibrio inopinatus]|uniref:efflux RND transporter periplasmic adaptor subunit n=1 Tax=Desulfovibrio inopinatus TaxID=102109 RepID=UPI00041CA2D4|nr:efflux RND transporter periplasmic adaptor subunit [Desulfovibrio inopinatus]